MTPLTVMCSDAMVSAAEEASLDAHADAVDAALPAVDPEEDETAAAA